MFHAILYQPLLNALVFLYQTVSFKDLGLAIILLTILVRVILAPLFYKSAKSQMIMQKIQPHLQKIQHEHKDNKERQAQAMMELYKQHKVNPFSGFLTLLVQLPIFIALYSLFNSFTKIDFNDLYKFIPRPEQLNSVSFGLINLGNTNIIIVILAAIAQYFQGKLSLPKLDKGRDLSSAEKMSRQMMFIGPVITLFVLWNLPAAVGIYWLVTTVFSLVQQIYINKSVKKTEV